MKFHQKVGPITIQLCFTYDGWITGECVDYLSNEEETKKPENINIIIPLDRWVNASKILHAATANGFGGFKLKDGEFEVNVWTDEVVRQFVKHETTQIYQPKYNILLGKK